MKNNSFSIRETLKSKGLKVTPQRMLIMEAFRKLDGHPTAENIIEYVREQQPNVATGTVYKVLETLTEKGIIKKVKTEADTMRYDGILDNHHHLYCSETGKIEDYTDPVLDNLLEQYFKKITIPNFKISDIKLHITGTFTH